MCEEKGSMGEIHVYIIAFTDGNLLLRGIK